MADLEKMILAKRQNQFSSFLGHLEQKYCQGEGEAEVLGSEDEEGWADIENSQKRKKKNLGVKVSESGKKRLKK